MKHTVNLEFQDFGWRALNRAAEREGVTVEELLVHAAMYYLADQDSGRLAHRVPPDKTWTRRSQLRPRT